MANNHHHAEVTVASQHDPGQDDSSKSAYSEDSFYHALCELQTQLHQFVGVSNNQSQETNPPTTVPLLESQQTFELNEKLKNLSSIIESSLVQGAGGPANDMDIVKKKINGILYTLIDQISVPEDFNHRKKSLCSELVALADWDVLPRILSESTSLVFISNSLQQHELGDYLLGLNNRLSEIHRSLNESKEIETISFEAEKSLDAQVKDAIEHLNDEVNKSPDLNQLKRTFHQNFDNILHLIDTHQSTSFEKREIVIDQLEQLSNRILSLENDTHRLHSIIEKQREESLKDSLTGLLNRGAYEEQGAKEIARLNRYGHALTLAVTDIDYFKKINDNHGHLAGDKALTLIAQVLKQRLRTSDLIARYGGEEFVILMPDTMLDGAHLAIEQLREAIESSAFDINGKILRLTASFGITQVLAGDSLEAAFDRADKALYEAKRLGRNCTHIS
jgi:diguanylate cyclase